MVRRGFPRLAGSRRRPLPAQTAWARSAAAGIGRDHVSAGIDDARRHVSAADRRRAHHHYLLRRIFGRPGVWSFLSAHGLAGIRTAGHGRPCARLRNQVPGGRGPAERTSDRGRLRNREGREGIEPSRMPKMNLSHFEAAILFALFSSVVLGEITKRTDAERLRYGVRCFAYFVAALIGLGWLMKLGHG